METLPDDWDFCPGGPTEPTALDALDVRERQFVLAYAKCFTAYRAAIVAGYAESSASAAGARLLRDKRVLLAIYEQLESSGMTVEGVKGRVADMAFKTDLADFEEWMTTKSMTLDELREKGVPTWLIRKAKVKLLPDGTVVKEIELHDAQKALETAAKILGVLKEIEDKSTPAGDTTTVNVIVQQIMQSLQSLPSGMRIPLPAGIPQPGFASGPVKFFPPELEAVAVEVDHD